MLILLSPWPKNYGLVWLTLVLMSVGSIKWHREEWTFTRKAWMLKGGELSAVAGLQHRRYFCQDLLTPLLQPLFAQIVFGSLHPEPGRQNDRRLGVTAFWLVNL